MRQRRATVVVVALLWTGCIFAPPNYGAKGDQAAAVGDWKNAVTWYRKALERDPSSTALKQKYDEARTQAISHALTVARRCQTERDATCVDSETGYVLELDPSNGDAAALRTAARAELAVAAIAEARALSVKGSFVEAVRQLNRARELSTDPEVMSAIDAAGGEIAAPAVAYVDALLQQAPPGDLEQQAQAYNEAVEILEAVLEYAPGQSALLAAARAKQQASARALAAVREREAAEARVAEDQRRAAEAFDRANTNRSVSITGVVIAPAKLGGTQWDGPGAGVTAALSGDVAAALAKTNPYTAVAQVLAGPTAAALEKPDVVGIAELYSGSRLVGRVDLYKVQDSFTPQWVGVGWNGVDIRAATVRINLEDADVMSNDPIGVVSIDAAQLLEAARKGGDYHFIVDGGSGQILLVQFSVL